MKKIILTLIQIILLGIMAFSAYRLGDYYLQRHKANRAYGDIRDSVIELRSESEEAKGPEIKVEKKPKPRDRAKEVMAYLKGINEDVVGFIEVHGTSIAYPIAQAKDNDYYLWRGLDDETNIQGTIFMDYRSNPDLEDKNTVIYGHLMQRGDMFNPLKNFYDQAYTSQAPKTLELITDQGLVSARIFSIMEIQAEDHDQILFSDREDWSDHLDQIRAKSHTDFAYRGEFKDDDRIISLSTCVEDYDEAYRTIVFALIE